MDKRETGDQDPAATSDPPFPAQIRPEIASLQTSGIAQLFALGPGRADLIALWVGEGDLPTPGFICEAAVRALGAGKTFYTDKRGIPELRAAIAECEISDRQEWRMPPICSPRFRFSSWFLATAHIAFEELQRSIRSKA